MYVRSSQLHNYFKHTFQDLHFSLPSIILIILPHLISCGANWLSLSRALPWDSNTGRMKGILLSSTGGLKCFRLMLEHGESSLKIAAAASLSEGEPCSGSRTIPQKRVNSTGGMLEEGKMSRTEWGKYVSVDTIRYSVQVRTFNLCNHDWWAGQSGCIRNTYVCSQGDARQRHSHYVCKYICYVSIIIIILLQTYVCVCRYSMLNFTT